MYSKEVYQAHSDNFVVFWVAHLSYQDDFNLEVLLRRTKVLNDWVLWRLRHHKKVMPVNSYVINVVPNYI